VKYPKRALNTLLAMKKVHKTPTGMEKEERRREKSFRFSFLLLDRLFRLK
jgi:hypothetical protein